VGDQGGRRGTVRADFFEACFDSKADSCWGVSIYGFVELSVEIIFKFLRSTTRY